LSRIHDISLKWKLLIPFLFLSFVGTTSLILLSLHSQNRLIESQENRKLFDYFRAFSDQIEDRKRSALSLAYLVARSPAVKEAFARRERRELIDLLLPSYQLLEEEFGVKQFHFHITPATSFLRLHRIYQSGEAMASFRQTINKVEQSGTGIAGLEWGITGFGVRGVAPVYFREQFIGTFEIGYSVERPFLESLKSRYNMELALYIPKRGGEGFSQLASSGEGCFPVLARETYRQVYQTQEPIILLSPPQAPGAAVFLGPLRDFSQESIGVVGISVDRSATLAKLSRNRNMMLGIMAAALLVSSTLIWWVAVLFLRPVHEIVGVAREIAAGKRVRRIDVRVRDEIGTLADSLNEMLASLNQARREVQQYCDTLEERVKERTRELVAEKEKYETLVENAPLIVYRIIPDGTTVFVNRYVEEVLGYTPAEVIDDRAFWTKTAHPDDRERLGGQLQTCLQGGRELYLEYRGIHRRGTEVCLFNQAIPLIDENGVIHGVDGIVVDVSERKRLQEKIIQTEELKTLSQVSARLAHEIRNPLTSAGGFARRLLQEMDLKDVNRPKVEIIVQEVGRLEQILKMILSYLRPIPLEFAEVDLNGVLGEAIDATGEKLKARGGTLELELDATIPAVRADRGHLRHAMEAILENACNHMRENGRIRVTTTRNGRAVVQLCYTGLHVADDDLEHFFYPFVAGKVEETDLELPLTKVVIHRHGGTITVERDEQDQVTITIAFPGVAGGQRL
jgi:PAS domain S-box-containing protein